MTSEFESDLAELTSDIEESRSELTAAISSLTGSQLDAARRGGWTIRRVLEHVIQAEHLYARVTAHLAGATAPARGEASCDGATVADIEGKLRASRDALLAALEGVSEDGFYTIQTFGHEQYSVFSLLENVANHDREHAAQVRQIAAAP